MEPTDPTLTSQATNQSRQARCIDELVKHNRTNATYQALVAELEPQGVLQHHFVRNLARGMEASDRADQMELAVFRRLAAAAVDDAADGHMLLDHQLTKIAVSEGLQRALAYGNSARKSIQLNLRALTDVQRQTNRQAAKRDRPDSVAAARFASEKSCEQYLVRRLRSPDFRCPSCGGKGGSWLSSRSRWQCNGCRRQLGIRAGTVMSRSQVPLTAWFRAIETLLTAPNTPLAELQSPCQVNRAATIRQMKSKILRALSEPDASSRLAGLDAAFSPPATAQRNQLAAQGVLCPQKTLNAQEH